MNTNSEQVAILNKFIQNEHHWEFHVYSFSPFELIIAGNYELSLGHYEPYSCHRIELIFKRPNVFCGRQHFSIEEPSEGPLRIVTSEKEIRKLNTEDRFLQGNEIFILKSNYGDIIIEAKSLTVREKFVLYKKMDGIPEGVELAYWL